MKEKSFALSFHQLAGSFEKYIDLILLRVYFGIFYFDLCSVCIGYIPLHNAAIQLSLIASETIIRDREDKLMEVGLSLCITKIGHRIILSYRLLFTSDQKIYNSFLEIFEIKINIFI